MRGGSFASVDHVVFDVRTRRAGHSHNLRLLSEYTHEQRRCLNILYIGRSDVTESMDTIRLPFRRYNMA